MLRTTTTEEMEEKREEGIIPGQQTRRPWSVLVSHLSGMAQEPFGHIGRGLEVCSPESVPALRF